MHTAHCTDTSLCRRPSTGGAPHLSILLLLVHGEEELLDVADGDQDEVRQVSDERHPQGTLLQDVIFGGGGSGGGGGGAGTAGRGGHRLWRDGVHRLQQRSEIRWHSRQRSERRSEVTGTEESWVTGHGSRQSHQLLVTAARLPVAGESQVELYPDLRKQKGKRRASCLYSRG